MFHVSSSLRAGLALCRCRRGLRTLLCLLGLLLLPQTVFAFDTGHHFDLVRNVLADEGFGDTAIKIVQVENWLTDYYSSSPTSPSAIKLEVDKLHFDNLFTTDAIRNYWGWLTLNTKDAAQTAAKNKDPLMLLTVLGISLHAVQDFYSHSNWVETHPRGRPPAPGEPYRTETWFSAPPGAGDNSLYTGAYGKTPPPGKEPHGDYTKGLNKDSSGRQPYRYWDEAYVFAYVASVQWVDAVKGWVYEVDPTFWDKAMDYTVLDSQALELDLGAAYRLSEWAYKSEEGIDGKWKGKGSGRSHELIVAGVTWILYHSRFVQEFDLRRIHELLSIGLTGGSAPRVAIPPVPITPLNRRAIIVRTYGVAEGYQSLIDPPRGDADFYAKITVWGQTFIEATQKDRGGLGRTSPAYWMTIKFVPATTARVPIKYQLWDEDSGGGDEDGQDDHIDINPDPKQDDLDFDFDVATHMCTGFVVPDGRVYDRTMSITGRYDTYWNAAFTGGNWPNRKLATIVFYVTERLLQPPPVDVTNRVSITRSDILYNKETQRYEQMVTLTNISDRPILGPISLVIDNLSSNAKLLNATDYTDYVLPSGTPYININLGPEILLSPDASRYAVLVFQNPSNRAITHKTRVLAGPGVR